jgi:glycine/D-amino acid oxidase-like deaminating enzyme
MGFVGYTFDNLPHLGEDHGLYYAMGYCGSGVCLASYFGHRLGQQAAARPDSESEIAMNGLRFQTRPLYRGNPWFLAPTIRYYQIKDRLN